MAEHQTFFLIHTLFNLTELELMAVIAAKLSKTLTQPFFCSVFLV